MQGVEHPTKTALAKILSAAACFLICPGLLGATASWYGEEHRGKLMANGKRFDPDKLTCASWFHTLGSRLTVIRGGRKVSVVVTDRGPNLRFVAQGRTIDLSAAAFRRLARPELGLVDVRIKK